MLNPFSFSTTLYRASCSYSLFDPAPRKNESFSLEAKDQNDNVWRIECEIYRRNKVLQLKGHVQVLFLGSNFNPHKIIYYNTSNELILVSTAFALFYFYSLTYQKRNECHFYQRNKLQPALNIRYVSAISTSSSSGSRGRLLGRLRGQTRSLRPLKTRSISVAEKDENTTLVRQSLPLRRRPFPRRPSPSKWAPARAVAGGSSRRESRSPADCRRKRRHLCKEKSRKNILN